MKINDPIKIKVVEQGGIIINNGWIVAISDNFVALEIDLKSKRGEITGSTRGKNDAPCIMLEGTPDSVHLKKGKEEKWTLINFPNFKGYYFWCGEICRYTLRVCLMKIKLYEKI
jgi:hypothetical protein